jgi:patatin-like phospholipase/acyl hydrolase
MDGYDFKMSDVCLATSADPTIVGAVDMRSVDKRTKIVAIDGGIAMNNPTAAAITHVLNNKQEFPLCNGVEDLLVVSLGNGESDFGYQNQNSTPARFVRIAGEGASDMVTTLLFY